MATLEVPLRLPGEWESEAEGEVHECWRQTDRLGFQSSLSLSLNLWSWEMHLTFQDPLLSSIGWEW